MNIIKIIVSIIGIFLVFIISIFMPCPCTAVDNESFSTMDNTVVVEPNEDNNNKTEQILHTDDKPSTMYVIKNPQSIDQYITAKQGNNELVHDITGGRQRKLKKHGSANSTVSTNNITNNIVDKYAGRKDNIDDDPDYTIIDEAEYKYALERMDDILGNKESNNSLNSTVTSSSITGRSDNIKKKINKSGNHNWYKYKSWEDLTKDKNARDQYFDDYNYARTHMMFKWDDVLKQVMPMLKLKTETIGVLRAHQDKETLFVYSMETSPEVGAKGAYAASVAPDLVEKYFDIPGYFIFHTHPEGGDPLPSDADIYTSLLDNYVSHFFGHVVIGQFGIIVYFLETGRKNDLTRDKKTSALKYFTFCYDLICAWNSICNSSAPMNEKDRLTFLEAWGYKMLIYPFPKWISNTYSLVAYPSVLHDRFIKTKYELADKIRSFIKKLEQEE